MDSSVVPYPASSEETILWEGHSSHVVNLPSFILCGLAVGLLLGAALMLRGRLGPNWSLALAGLSILPLSIMVGKWLQNRCRRYEVTTERIHLRRGVLARKKEDLEV